MANLPRRLPGLQLLLHGVTLLHAEHPPAPPDETGPVIRRRYHALIWLSLRQNLDKNRARIWEKHRPSWSDRGFSSLEKSSPVDRTGFQVGTFRPLIPSVDEYRSSFSTNVLALRY